MSSADYSGLVPGHKHVESFSEDLEEEYEEETTYVTLDLGGNSRSVLAGGTSYRLVGLDTRTPMLQIGSTTYKGTHETLLGSELLFSGPRIDDPRLKGRIAYFSHASERRIRFKEVTLHPKPQRDRLDDRQPGASSHDRSRQASNVLNDANGAVDDDLGSDSETTSGQRPLPGYRAAMHIEPAQILENMARKPHKNDTLATVVRQEALGVPRGTRRGRPRGSGAGRGRGRGSRKGKERENQMELSGPGPGAEHPGGTQDVIMEDAHDFNATNGPPSSSVDPLDPSSATPTVD